MERIAVMSGAQTITVANSNVGLLSTESRGNFINNMMMNSSHEALIRWRAACVVQPSQQYPFTTAALPKAMRQA